MVQTKKRSFKRKSLKTRRYLLPGIKIIFVCFLIIGLLVSGSWFFRQRKQVEVHGTANLTAKQLKSLSDQEKYQSLDLRIAKLAVYKGAPLKVVKDLGRVDNVRQQVVSFPVYSANLTEYGLMTLPVSSPPTEGYPVIILCHGYVDPTHYSTYEHYLTQMEYYSQHGFAVIKPDFRGQGLSIKSGKPEGAYFSMAYNVDVQSLIASIEQSKSLNKDKINLWGHSIGAYIALRAAVLSPIIKNVILLSGPVSSLEEMYSVYTPPSDRSNPVAQLVKSTVLSAHGPPPSNPDFWDNTSVLKFLDQTNARIQIHVGGKDKIVPPEFSVQLDSTLTKAHKVHQYFYYPDGDHGLGPQMPLILQRSLNWMQ